MRSKVFLVYAKGEIVLDTTDFFVMVDVNNTSTSRSRKSHDVDIPRPTMRANKTEPADILIEL